MALAVDANKPTKLVSKTALEAENRKKKQDTRRNNSKQLAEGYTAGKRALDLTSPFLYLVGWLLCWRNLAGYYKGQLNIMTDPQSYFLAEILPMCVIALPLGMLLADFFSGFAHWGFDTWGTPETPVFGAFVRAFREHHIDPLSITRHDFFETNGDTFLVCVPFLILMAMHEVVSANSIYIPTNEFILPFYFSISPFLAMTLLWCSVFVAVTNECHKCAHDPKPQSFIIQMLMDYHLMLNKAKHLPHHKGLFEDPESYHSYCITTGWLNPPLEAIKFWDRLEGLVTRITGIEPRSNDKVLRLSDDAEDCYYY